MGTLIRGGTVVDPANGVNAVRDVLIDGDTVVRVDARIPAGSHTIVDARNCIVTPGLVDMHVHLRQPGLEDKEDITTGGRAALRGGVTTAVCMANTNPVIDNAEVVSYVRQQALEADLANIFVIGAVTRELKGEQLTEIADLAEAGVVALSDDGMPVMDSNLLRMALEYARPFGLPIISHCEDKCLSCGGAMREGPTSTRLGCPGVPSASESAHVARDILLAQMTGGHIHIAHCSTAQSVEFIRLGKRWGVNVTAETCPHYFSLTDEAVGAYDTNAKMNPPLQTAEDIAAIQEGLADGTLSVIATDHAPHTPEQKATAFTEAPFGIIGLETSFALANTKLIASGLLTLDDVIAKMTVNPAALLKLPRGIGTLSPGAQADVSVFDLAAEWTYDVADSASKSRNSPFDGWNLKGRTVHVFARGRQMVADGTLVV